jgi:hypothetical protein
MPAVSAAEIDNPVASIQVKQFAKKIDF